MCELLVSNDLAIKINHEYKVFKLYPDCMIPNSDYLTNEIKVSCGDNDIKQIAEELKNMGYIQA